MIAALVGWVLLGTSAADSVYGTVRIAGSADPVPGAVIDVMDSPLRTWADSLGRYSLVDLPPGARTLRFSCLGCEARTVQVFLGADSALHLDVSLAAHPVALPPIAVSGETRPDVGSDEGGALTPLGEWRFVEVAPGVGLGLAISRGFVEAMRGTITAANRTDRGGAAFTIRLPVPASTEKLDTAA